MSEDLTNILAIRGMNDQFRMSLLSEHGGCVITRGVDALGAAFFVEALAAVRAFTAFTPENDPYDEHDVGGVELYGEKLFWKIDYYDPEWQYCSADPADAARTKRVLTIMLAEEY